MLVFIDESGDPGFKIAKGTSTTFVLAMVIFSDHSEAAQTQKAIRDLLGTAHRRPEFKFNKCRPEVRDLFFEKLRDRDFVVRSIVVRKVLIWSERLRTDDETFHRFFCKSMVTFDNQTLKGAKLVIDGSGDRQFRRNLTAYLKSHSGDGAVADIKVRDSVSELLLQLADMCIGAIARSYRTDHDKPDRWRWMLGANLKIFGSSNDAPCFLSAPSSGTPPKGDSLEQRGDFAELKKYLGIKKSRKSLDSKILCTTCLGSAAAQMQ